MPDQYIKVDGVWVAAKRPYVKRNNVWMPVKERFNKQGGGWISEWAYDITPPDPPQLSLEILPAKNPRYIRVGARMPGTAHDGELKRIRVLASRDGMPTTQFGNGYLRASDTRWPHETWSDWMYNEDKSLHGDTWEWDYKEYPVNPTDATNLPGKRFYYFAAWAEDFEGNWSSGTFQRIWMPKQGVPVDRKKIKEIKAQANVAGSITYGGASFVEGRVMARQNPRSNGVWYHGNKITNSVGEHGAPSIRRARIRISRANDAGQPTARVRLYYHEQATWGAPLTGPEQKDPTVVGRINKGETKWFDLPASWHSLLNHKIKGFGLRFGEGAQDYIVSKSLTQDPRNGEVHIVWDEEL